MICNRFNFLFPFFLFLVVGGYSLTFGEIIHVPGQVETIKAGISAAGEGDTVMVSVGTYYGPGNRDLDFGGKAITVMSMKGATLTIIDCQGEWLGFHRGFYAHQGEDSNTVIQGFTVINGYAPFNGTGGQSMGGGILCINNSSPTIRDCVLYNNYAAGAGGGLACVGGSSPVVSTCTFVDNSAVADANNDIIGYGGGIFCQSSSPVFIDCIIASNLANVGGGMACGSSAPDMENCEFSDNLADVYISGEPLLPGSGGGIYLDQSTAVLSYCIINGNRAGAGINASATSGSGGAINAINSNLTLNSCTIYGNLAEQYDEMSPGRGAGLFLSESPAQFEKVIVANNDGGKAVACDYTDPQSRPAFLCSDIYGNELGDWTDSIADQNGIDGNFSLAPYFCDPDIGNLNLWAYSPCTPDSNTCGVLIGALDIGCLTDAEDAADSRPHSYVLNQNVPNPFNQSTSIEFRLPAAAPAKVIVYNLLGQVVQVLADGFLQAGTHRVMWDGKDTEGDDVASGLYFYTIDTDRYSESKQMILLK